mmetsp:Transcript_12925/g.30553  ORF Transcript_12925/g.30553 Transcript_12925/m.30553 type:complete len:396 (-) Transcript_12925:29-1216(-)
MRARLKMQWMHHHQQQQTGLRMRVTRERCLLLSALLIVIAILGLTGPHRDHIQRDDPKAEHVDTATRTDKPPSNVTIANVQPDRPVEVQQGVEVVRVSDAEIKPDPKVERGFSIYLFNTLNESNQISSIEWDHVASIWGRNTTYNHLVQESSSLHDQPRAPFSMPNITVLFHTFPKTGSSTLRHACLETQYNSCGMPRKRDGMKWPEGYRKPSRLNEVFARCPDTRHFCLDKKNTYLTQQYAIAHETRIFLHLFPFRNYDEWLVSALRQIYYREGEKGCRKEMKLLEDCQPHKYEMDYKKYVKAGLAKFVKSLKRKMKENDESEWRRHHHALLYNYVHLDRLMSWLNDNCDVPLLPGTQERLNSNRPNETCSEEEQLLSLFHNCFDSQHERYSIN